MFKSHVKITAFFCAIVMAMSIGGVFATWKYAEVSPQSKAVDILAEMNEFVYIEELP